MKLSILDQKTDHHFTGLISGERWDLESTNMGGGKLLYLARARDRPGVISLEHDHGVYAGTDGEITLLLNRILEGVRRPLLCIAEYGDDAETLHDLMRFSDAEADFADVVRSVMGNDEKLAVCVAFSIARSLAISRWEHRRRVLWAGRAAQKGIPVDYDDAHRATSQDPLPPETDTDCEIDIYDSYDTEYNAEEVLL